MMKKTWMGVAALTFMTGCTSTQYILDDQVTASREVNPVQGPDGNYLGSIDFRRPFTDVTPADLHQCLNSTLEQRRIDVQRLSLRSPVGNDDLAFNSTATEDVSEAAHVTGVTQYQARNIGYRLEVQRLPEANYYYFDQLGEAISHDATQFTPVGAWSEANPMQVAHGLEAVADQVQACLQSVASNQPGEDPTGWQPQS